MIHERMFAMRFAKTVMSLVMSALLLVGGTLLLAPAASAAPAATTASSASSTGGGVHTDSDSVWDLVYAKCYYGKDVGACQRLAQHNNQKLSKNALKCLATAGIAVGGLFVGDGLPDAIALATARKYVASGTASCIAVLVTSGIK